MATAPRLPSDPQPHPPTETGPLTGVANFVWNGTTWAASDGSGGGGGAGGDLAVGSIVTPTYSFTRPADVTQYNFGDLIANNTVAGSVVPMSWVAARVAGGSIYVRRVRLHKSDINSSAFRVHLYQSVPTGIVNGDNGAFLTNAAGYCGAFDLNTSRTFTDGAGGVGVPVVGAEVSIVVPSGQTIYGLIEALGSYTPVASEVFTITLEVQQN